MRWSVSISSLIHVALLASAVVVLPDPEEFEVTTSEAVPVEIISEEEVPKPVPPEKPPEEAKKPEPPKLEPPKPEPKQEVAALPPKPEPEPTPKPDPVEEPPQEKPVEEKPPEPKPEAKPETPDPLKKLIESHKLPQKKPKAPKRPKEKPPERFDDTINALLNKLPDETSAPLPDVTEETEPTDTPRTAAVSQSGTQLEREQIAEIVRAKMSQCWNPPAALKDAHNLKVTFNLAFDRSGGFARAPQSETAVSDSITRAAVESARRALMRCAPYPLPEETYDVWKDMVLNFRPITMF